MARRLWGLRYGTDTSARSQRLLGVAGLAAAVLMIVASAVMYFVPLGKHTYSAVLNEADSVRPGDDVRIAGISVGSVQSVELTDDAVLMRFTVKTSVALGDTTTLDIRMLTPIGGHYIAVSPSGDAPLGSKTIPAERIRLPYSLAQTFQDAQRVVSGIDGNTLRSSVADLTAALQNSPGSIDSVVNGMSTIVGIINTQNQDLRNALAVAEEYLSMLSESRKIVGAMLTKLGQMESQVLNRRGEVLTALQVTTELVSRIAALEPAWTQQLEPLTDRLLAAKPDLDQLGQKLGVVADDLAQAGQRLQSMITPEGIGIDQSGTTVTPRPVCVPTPGRGC
ncbi:MCE family protein [Nocardia sp. 2]|uniref:MCE family protein n=2 Tax=Nocardia acididurans TaxID=2802282 RepID=A0ABS1MG12_9NOCA|nr:MCE family protein [Nocardia acididurans]